MAKKKTIFDKCKSYKDACKLTRTKYDAKAPAMDKLRIIIQALNEGEKIDLEDTRTTKWYPIFYRSVASDWAFYYSHCSYYCPGRVGYVLSEEKSDYLGKKFLPLWKQMFKQYK